MSPTLSSVATAMAAAVAFACDPLLHLCPLSARAGCVRALHPSRSSFLEGNRQLFASRTLLFTTSSSSSHGCRRIPLRAAQVSPRAATAPSVELPSAAAVAKAGATEQSRSSRSSSGRTGRGVVITGGCKGLGYAMALEFLLAGDDVVLCGRSESQVEEAVDSLKQAVAASAAAADAGDAIPAGPAATATASATASAHDSARGAAATAAGDVRGVPVFGTVCDVGVAEDVDALAAFAREKLGTVHVWINNAGQVTSKRLLADVPVDEIVSAVSANVVGSLLGSRAAVRLMREQQPQQSSSPSSSSPPPPPYRIFNLGFSRWGASFTKSAATHKSTKIALSQLTASLNEELKQAGLGDVIRVHNLSPGMVLTDLLLKDSTPVARRFFNALAEEPETVATALVPQIREMTAADPAGVGVDFLTPVGAVTRVLTRVPQILNGGRFFDREGRRVAVSGEEYADNGVRLQHASRRWQQQQQQQQQQQAVGEEL